MFVLTGSLRAEPLGRAGKRWGLRGRENRVSEAGVPFPLNLDIPAINGYKSEYKSLLPDHCQKYDH